MGDSGVLGSRAHGGHKHIGVGWRIHLQADPAEEALRGDDGNSRQVGHDISVGRGVVWRGDKDVHARLRDSLGVSGRILRENGAVLSAGIGQLRGDSDLQVLRGAGASAATRASVPTVSGTSTFCGPRLSATRTCHSRRTTEPGGGRLREDVSCGDIRGVVAIVDIEVEAHAGGLAARFGHGHAFQRGDFDFGTVDGEVHRGDGGEQERPR